MTRLAQIKKVSIFTATRMIKKMWEKSLTRSKKSLLSAATVQKRLERRPRLLNDLEIHGNWILIFSDEKTFSVDPVFNKQIDRVVAFRKDVSEYSRVSTNKHLSAIMMLCVVESNREKMHRLWHRLISPVCKEGLETKVLPCAKKISKNSDYIFQHDRHTWQRLYMTEWMQI